VKGRQRPCGGKVCRDDWTRRVTCDRRHWICIALHGPLVPYLIIDLHSQYSTILFLFSHLQHLSVHRLQKPDLSETCLTRFAILSPRSGSLDRLSSQQQYGQGYGNPPPGYGGYGGGFSQPPPSGPPQGADPMYVLSDLSPAGSGLSS
jgi:hypothetical protein